MKKRQGGFALRKTMQEQPETQMSSPPGMPSFCKHIPNILSTLRLIGTPLSVWIIAHDQLTTAFWIFFAVCVTDWLDGYLARRWHVTSKLGQILDPLADKFLLISVYLALGLWRYIPMWATFLVLTRDFLILTISCGIILNRKVNIRLTPQFMGKVSTTFQMLFIGLVLAGEVAIPSIPTASIESILMVFFLYSMALTTILSGITYARVAYRALRIQ